MNPQGKKPSTSLKEGQEYFIFALSNRSTNSDNSKETTNHTCNRRTYTNYFGNYWNDYEGTDADGDGIGNTHYSIDLDSDESDDYPLMKPFENFNIPTSAYT